MTQPPFIPENRILRPRPSTATDSNEWPEFELHNTSAVSQRTGEVVSLLEARERNPLTVTGTLQPLTSNLASHYRPGAGGTRTVNIELKSVVFFAYGQSPNGSTSIWAAGEAGWFAIQPSRAYRGIYNQMRAAVSIFYFVMDVYQDAGWKGGKTTGRRVDAKELFARYANEELRNPDAVAAATDEIYRHRDFLLVRMLTDEEHFRWEGNPFFCHLRQRFLEEYRAIRDDMAPLPKVAKSSTLSGSKTKNPRDPKGATSSNNKRNGNTRAGAEQKSTTTRTTRHSSRSPGTPATPLQEDDDSSDGADDELGLLGVRRKGLGRSALRPKASKASKGRKGPAGNQNEANDQSTSEDELQADIPTPTGRKRKSAGKHAQRRSRRLREAGDEPNDDDSSELSSAPDTPSSSSESNHLDNTHLETSRDPLQEDTFLCPLPPCTHKIFSVSTSLGKGLIKEHLASHSSSQDDDQRIQLVRKLQAPSLPAGRLMEKVLGAAADRAAGMGDMGLIEGSRVAGTRFPAATRPVGQGVIVRY